MENIKTYNDIELIYEKFINKLSEFCQNEKFLKYNFSFFKEQCSLKYDMKSGKFVIIVSPIIINNSDLTQITFSMDTNRQ